MPEINKDRYVVYLGWDGVPHLTEATKRELLAAYPAHEREARTKGVPGLGSGAVYTIQTEDFVVAPFEIPPYWPRAYGLDVGWNKTAALWGAWDRESDILYAYTEHYQGKMPPAVHAAAILARGKWIPGVIDPAAKGRSQADGTMLMHEYQNLGLVLSVANNAVEAGLFAVQQRLSTGRLKIFSSCRNLLQEYRFYRRDLDGKIVKSNDHLLDAMRYLCLSGASHAIVEPSAGSDTIEHQCGDRATGY